MSKKVIFNNEATEKHRRIADIFHENTEVKGATASEKENLAVYKQALEESDLGMSMAQVEKLKRFESDLLKGHEIFSMEAAATAFGKDIKEEKFNTKVGLPVGGKMQSTVYRQKQYSNNFAKEGESKVITKNLVITTKVDNTPTRGISSLREALQKEYEEKHLK